MSRIESFLRRRIIAVKPERLFNKSRATSNNSIEFEKQFSGVLFFSFNLKLEPLKEYTWVERMIGFTLIYLLHTNNFVIGLEYEDLQRHKTVQNAGMRY